MTSCILNDHEHLIQKWWLTSILTVRQVAAAKRPTDLEATPKKKIVPLAGELLRQEDIDVSVGSSSSSDVALSLDEKTPDDLTTPDVTNDSVFGSLDWACKA